MECNYNTDLYIQISYYNQVCFKTYSQNLLLWKNFTVQS